jgi:hypothetical protein
MQYSAATSLAIEWTVFFSTTISMCAGCVCIKSRQYPFPWPVGCSHNGKAALRGFAPQRR